MKNKSIKKILASSIALTVLVWAILPMLFTQGVGYGQARLSLSFEGIENGLDAQGNIFDINSVKDSSLLKKTLKNVSIDEKVTTKELRDCIGIKPLMGGNALQELTKISSVSGKTKDVAVNSANTGEYSIRIDDVGLLQPLSGRKLTSELLKSYKVQMKAEYLKSATMDRVYSQEEILALDYPEMLKIAKQEADVIVKYIEAFEKSSPEFVSEESGISFANLRKRAELIRDIDIGSNLDIVNYYVLNKDKTTRQNYENTKLRRINLETVKAEGREQALTSALVMYNNSTNYMVMQEDVANVNLKNENIFYGQLAERYVQSKNVSIASRYDATITQRNIDKLNAGTLTAAQETQMEKEILVAVNNAYESMEQLRAQAQSLAEENFDLNIGSKIQISRVSYKFNTWGNLVIIFLLCLVGSGLLYSIAEFLKSKEKGFVKAIAKRQFEKWKAMADKKLQSIK